MTTRRGNPYQDADARHRASVARSLRWADEAAERADFADALGWVRIVEVVDGALPDEYQTKRNGWRLALSSARESGHTAQSAGNPETE
jgi:hypothetical protein